MALRLDNDPVHDEFRCHCSKMALVEDDPKSPRCLTFDHVVPGGEEKGNMVLTSALYN